ncbi:glycosyltransferase family 39 protein [Vibrio sp. S11_S32]|uniref:ArnT family glycosyltransferase n=1 Tax=Vibrio sp. S11_S32 TaxID=2720225 RepID=UPI001680F1C7|nr:glycosyltransferase family 39 protein [Vibrio sp. S11_S32]MBD1576541.1 glycosyltransferase family 39 protein [Vibrio sp. S11_S32]
MNQVSGSIGARCQQAWRNEDYYQTLLFLLVIAAVIILAGAGFRDPWPADEPRFVEVAREMVQSGNWFFPMRGGELYPDKPPVFMWSMAAFYWLTGSLKATFMLPNAIVSLMALVCCYDISAKLWNVKTARTVGLLLLIAPQFIIQAKAAQIDAMVAAWITIAMYGLLRHFFVKTSWTWYCVAWGFMGLGIITKGVGFLPALLLIPILFLHFSGKHRFEEQVSWKLLWGPVAMLAVVACWLIPMLSIAESSHNPDFIAYKNNILFKQTGQRYAHSWGHIKPWYYFVVSVIPAMWFPLYFVFFNKKFWQQSRQSVVIISLLAWIALVVVFFSFSPGKRGVYILPALPMMALIAGHFLARETWQPWVEKLLKGLIAVLGVAMLVAAGMALFKAHVVTKALGDDTLPYAAFFIVAGAVWLLAFWKGLKKPALCSLGAALAITWVLYSFVGYSLLNPMRTPAKAMMLDVQQKIGSDGELGLTRFKEQFLLFSPISLTHFSYLDEATEQDRNAWQWMKEKPNRYIMTTNSKDMECFDRTKAVDLGMAHRRDWILLDSRSLLTTCTAPQEKKRYHLTITQPYS